MAIDTSAFDQGVRPQDDLFRYVNGKWLAEASIAADRSQAGSFVTLTDEAEEVVRGIVEDARDHPVDDRSEEHTSELQSRFDLVCRLLLEKKKTKQGITY